ncbi:LmrA/YxaF family transcription factor [Nocardioides limicola]|uniref:LmrA/YxaF family transcription factor n=1 Tax=Nocardioides limicola TaxID=2803368 RepID=UPI00193B1DF6|nr:hypothetical protein [Nocardioides sp. DJM-14]
MDEAGRKGCGRPGRAAAAEAFHSWADELSAALVAEGREVGEAESLARFIVAAVEGALMVARSARSTQPLYDAARQVGVLLGAGG